MFNGLETERSDWPNLQNRRFRRTERVLLPAVALYRQRTFNMGMLGKQNETFPLDSEGDWTDFNGGFGKFNLKVQSTMSSDGHGMTIRLKRFVDEARTIRHKGPDFKKFGLRQLNLLYTLSEDGRSMVCKEFLRYEESDEVTPGWSYSMRRVA